MREREVEIRSSQSSARSPGWGMPLCSFRSALPLEER